MLQVNLAKVATVELDQCELHGIFWPRVYLHAFCLLYILFEYTFKRITSGLLYHPQQNNSVRQQLKSMTEITSHSDKAITEAPTLTLSFPKYNITFSTPAWLIRNNSFNVIARANYEQCQLRSGCLHPRSFSHIIMSPRTHGCIKPKERQINFFQEIRKRQQMYFRLIVPFCTIEAFDVCFKNRCKLL